MPKALVRDRLNQRGDLSAAERQRGECSAFDRGWLSIPATRLLPPRSQSLKVACQPLVPSTALVVDYFIAQSSHIRALAFLEGTEKSFEQSSVHKRCAVFYRLAAANASAFLLSRR
jgi:hypothetical protein